MPYSKTDRDYERERYGRTYRDDRHLMDRDDRHLMDRAGDEVRSWFGDEDAGRRRRMDDRLYEHRSREERYARSRYALDDLKVSEVMSRNVITVYPDDTIERAARLMGECDCGSLPVINHEGRLVGMVTDRDITVRIAGRGLDPRYARVDECMSDDVIACHANDPVRECMRTMSQHQIRRVPIVYDRDRVVGIVSQGDLARYAGASHGQGERRAVADVLCAVSEPSYAPRR